MLYLAAKPGPCRPGPLPSLYTLSAAYSGLTFSIRASIEFDVVRSTGALRKNKIPPPPYADEESDPTARSREKDGLAGARKLRQWGLRLLSLGSIFISI